LTLLCTILAAVLILSACSAGRGQFDDQGALEYGDLRVTLLESGFDKVYEGFVCDDEDFRHPFVTLQLACSDEAESGCHVKLTLAVKYEDGASWGKDRFSSSTSSTDFQPKTLFLKPGATKEITFRPNSAVRQCWSINEPVKQITVVLRDETGDLKDLRASYKPQ
jgi:hypothetical protein